MENNSTECSERAEIRTVELESSRQSLYSYFLTYSRLKKTKKSLTAQDLPQMGLNNVCTMVLVPHHWENIQKND